MVCGGGDVEALIWREKHTIPHYMPLQRKGYKQSSKLSQPQNTQLNLNLLTVTFLPILK